MAAFNTPWRRRSLLAPAMALAIGTLAGCVVVPADRYYGGGYHGGVVTTAPPGEVAEVVGVAPGPGYFWIGGFWNWVGHRHVWVGGRWEAHRPGYHWQPHRWHRDSHGWRATPGQWQRQRR